MITKEARSHVCPECGKTFLSRHLRAKFCRNPCGRGSTGRKRQGTNGTAYFASEKTKAHQAVTWAIKAGILVPQACESCGLAPSVCHKVTMRDGKKRNRRWVCAHHDDHGTPLAVRWMCVSCHGSVAHGTGEPDDRYATEPVVLRCATRAEYTPPDEVEDAEEKERLRRSIKAAFDQCGLQTVWYRCHGLTLETIGKLMGLTRERVRQKELIEKDAMRRFIKRDSGGGR